MIGAAILRNLFAVLQQSLSEMVIGRDPKFDAIFPTSTPDGSRGDLTDVSVKYVRLMRALKRFKNSNVLHEHFD